MGGGYGYAMREPFMDRRDPRLWAELGRASTAFCPRFAINYVISIRDREEILIVVWAERFLFVWLDPDGPMIVDGQ